MKVGRMACCWVHLRAAWRAVHWAGKSAEKSELPTAVEKAERRELLKESPLVSERAALLAQKKVASLDESSVASMVVTMAATKAAHSAAKLVAQMERTKAA